MIAINQVTTLFLAVLLFVLGTWLVSKIRILNKFCIPAPVVGGLIFAALATMLKAFDIIEIQLDTSLQSLFMLAFFTTVGLGASFKLIRLGGKLLIIYWLACGFLAIMQNLIGVSLAFGFGIDPLLGVMAGSVSMEGGHGGAAAFGETLEGLGVASAMTVGAAAATCGLVAGGLVGGPIVQYLVKKYNLKPVEDNEMAIDLTPTDTIHANSFVNQVFIIVMCMSLGSYLGDWFSSTTGFVLPSYVGAMFVAVITRNIIDKVKPGFVNMNEINLISDVSLGIFLSMALMSVKLWEIADLALPLFGIIFVQVVFIVLFSVLVLFKLLGKNYDAAVMIAGFLGHGLGATPNAMANMSAVTGKFGPSHKAFLIVPIVGAFLIDVIGVPVIITTINLLT